MTVLSRGARGRRGGRRPGWVLLTALLVLAIGASSALVFTNRVELLKLAVILALWAAVAGAFVSVLYRRQSDADQARVRDLKLVYDLQLDREISARREYELTVESQLRRELASELRAQAGEDLAALRAELSALRTSLEILFDADLQHHPALETLEAETPPERAYSEWDRNGEGPRDAPVDWVASNRMASVHADTRASRADETAIIDVPEEPLLPPRQPPRARRNIPGWPQEPAAYVPPAQPEPRFETRQQPAPAAPPPAAAFQTAPAEQPQMQGWQPAAETGLWLPPGTPGNARAGDEILGPRVGEHAGRRRARHAGAEEYVEEEARSEPAPTPPPPYAESGRRSRSRHSAEYRDYGVRNFTGAESTDELSGEASAFRPLTPPVVAPAPPAPSPGAVAAEPAPPQMAPPPVPRHRGAEQASEGTETGGQSVAELLARLRVEPSTGGRRRRRDD